MNTFETTSQRLIKDSVTRMYAWMAAGLMITGITSMFLYSSGLFLQIIYSMPMLALVLVVAQLVLVMSISFGMAKMRASTMKLLYLLYAFTLGISMTSIAYSYQLGTIAIAFGITALYFICLVAIGRTTNLDLSKFGTMAYICLAVMIVSQLVMALFRVSMDTRFMSICGLLIFTGITAYDVQRANSLLQQNHLENEGQEKIVIFMALQMYLDFINIFLYIVRLLGNRRN